MLTTGICITLNNLLISIRLSSSRETKRILIEMMQMSKNTQAHQGCPQWKGGGWGMWGIPIILRFFPKRAPMKTDAPHGVHPPLKNHSPPSHLKNTSSPLLKSEAPFHEVIPRKKHNK